MTRAEAAERAGRREEAFALWSELVAAHPGHPRALFLRGRRRMDEGDAAGALALFTQSEALDASLPEAPFYAAVCHRHLRESGAALAAVERALALDPYYFMALLSKGAILEDLGKHRLAARTYRNAIKIAPSDRSLPRDARAALQHAREQVAGNANALAEHLKRATTTQRSRYAGERLERFDESLDILAGVKLRQAQDPTLLYYPRLPAIPFFDRDHFDWLPRLEAATAMIQGELEIALRDGRGAIEPYIQYPPGAPVNQWARLNRSPAWSSYFLWRDGEKQDANCARCPQTAALLESLPLAQMPGFAPTAMFSVLSPHTHIPPHTGSANTRVIVHLPLVLPPACRFRVGNDTRTWEIGQAWVFDDTIEHEAWNDSGETRVILIFDVWNPLLSEAERALVIEMLAALNAYNAAEL
ncbi:MAG: aspartyl/asparaginyl beta-hydroxylase domain-containing protein [Proteobacteria bacterium]|nr:aspartyl/asparaginyl beta-hydroxylase domain-containing protein [Pseudomonadota bacterium]